MDYQEAVHPIHDVLGNSLRLSQFHFLEGRAWHFGQNPRLPCVVSLRILLVLFPEQ